MIVGFFTAFLLSRKIRFTGFYLTLLFIPWVIAQIIAGLVFRLLVVPDYGLLSGILQNPALFPPNGLSILTAVTPKPWIGGLPFSSFSGYGFAHSGFNLAGVALCDSAAAGFYSDPYPKKCWRAAELMEQMAGK